MNLLAGARWLLALATRPATRSAAGDPADMGTAFGLDAITTLEPQLDTDAGAHEPPERTRFEHRLHRRSTF